MSGIAVFAFLGKGAPILFSVLGNHMASMFVNTYIYRAVKMAALEGVLF